VNHGGEQNGNAGVVGPKRVGGDSFTKQNDYFETLSRRRSAIQGRVESKFQIGGELSGLVIFSNRRKNIVEFSGIYLIACFRMW